MNRDPLGGGDRQPFMPAEWVSDDPDVVTIRVERPAPGLLVVGNTWMPGWSARVDASPAPCSGATTGSRSSRSRGRVGTRSSSDIEPPGPRAGTGDHGRGSSWGGLGIVLWCVTPSDSSGRLLRSSCRDSTIGTGGHGGRVFRPSRDACGGTIRASAGSRRAGRRASCPRPCARSGCTSR